MVAAGCAILLVAGLAWRGSLPRTDRVRAAFVLWGGWLLVTGLVFSLGKGIIHQYYSVALAPAIGAIVGMAGGMLWKRRHDVKARAVLAGVVLTTSIWAFDLLGHTPQWNPWLRGTLLLVGVLVAGALLAAPVHGLRPRGVAGCDRSCRGARGYTPSTVNTPHTCAIPTAGPAGASTMGIPGGPGGFRARGTGGPEECAPAPGRLDATAGGAPANGGGAGGLLNGSTASAALRQLLDADSSSYTWVAATVGANQASGYQLATDDPIMAIGGFNGTDPTPTLAQFQQYVREGRIHYFIGGGGFGGGVGGGGTTSPSAQISSWVSANFSSRTVGGVTVYDLTTGAA